MNHLTGESAKQFAQDALNRVKGMYKTMKVSGVDSCRVYVGADGFIMIEVSQQMHNSDTLVYTYCCQGEVLGEENRVILDIYGYEVA